MTAATPQVLGQAYQYWASNQLIVVQSRLQAPSYAGPGRWVIVHALSRRTFLATGPDVVPQVLRIVAAGCGAGTKGSLPEDGGTGDQLKKLFDSGLLATEPENERSLTELYHDFTYDYPFEDYGAPDWRERDLELMRHYASMWPPPPPQSRYSGEPRYALRSFSLGDDLETVIDQLRGGTAADRIAFLLQFVFSSIGEVSSKFMTCIRRTSPSGGARHPTEVLVEAKGIFGDMPPGTYAYDAATHALVRRTARMRHDGNGAGSSAFITIFSTVERAMWRYRDVRSYRPILLDLGHITQMVRIVAQVLGLRSIVSLPQQPFGLQTDWFSAPDFLDIKLQDGEDPAEPTRSESIGAVEPLASIGDGARRLTTNPLAYLTSSAEGLIGHVAWPARSRLAVVADDFSVLNHCIPSQRGDRDTSISGILLACDTTKERLHALYHHNLLIDEDAARAAYSGTRLWSRYGWYLSLLKLADARASFDGQRPVMLNTELNGDYTPDTLRKLLHRHTCRSFLPWPITADVVTKIVRAGVYGTAISAVVAPFAVDGLDAGIYRWTDDRLVASPVTVTREKIAKATIGQIPSSSGAATIWLLADISNLADPVDYETSIIAAGMAAHRICVSATELGLGVFLTPALSERETFQLLGLDGEPRTAIPYLLCIGRPRDGRST
jgi:SagB-type dehydrogenase family enzyme